MLRQRARIPDPRPGTSLGFHIFPRSRDEATLGDPERIIWSSIKHLCAQEVAEEILYVYHQIRSSRTRRTIARNIKLYIRHAAEFYEVAQDAKPNTAPLIYYYSFLNLAKARAEIYQPRFHERKENYRHGLSWNPDPRKLVDIGTESVLVTTRGVWHVLWEALCNQPCRIQNPQRIRIRDLFSVCPEMSSEFSRTFLTDQKIIGLIDPDIRIDLEKNEIWVALSVDVNELRRNRISEKGFLALVTHPATPYRRVKCKSLDTRSYEFRRGKNVAFKSNWLDAVQGEINKMNLFAYLHTDQLSYGIPVPAGLPVALPQVMVLYTLMFWLGSLVRYDPHSVAALQESKYWILIDGFMNQSRIWLLELLEWDFYKASSTLRYAR